MKLIRNFAALVVLIITVPTVLAEEALKHNYKPEVGYVPNAETAIKIAVAVWEPIYSQERIAS